MAVLIYKNQKTFKIYLLCCNTCKPQKLKQEFLNYMAYRSISDSVCAYLMSTNVSIIPEAEK